MPNPMTGKVPGAKKKKRKPQKKPEEETGDQIDLSTLIYYTQSPVRLTDRSHVLCLKLGSLRLNRLLTYSLIDDLDYINSLTRPKFLETIGQLDRMITTTPNQPASLILDACVRRFVYVSSDSREPDWPMADLDCVPWVATIHDLHSALLRVMVSQTMTTARRPLAHLIRKCLPRRSAGRKFDSVVTKYMKASKLVETTIYSLLMASLMGHYTHSASHLSLHARLCVHQWFDPTPVNPEDTAQRNRMRENLMKWCPALFVFAVRDHLIHLLDDDPAARKHFDAKYDYGQFRSITLEAIAAVRQYFETNLKAGGTLTADYPVPVVGDPTCKRELCKIFARVHTKMLRIQAAPTSPSLFEFVGCLRGQVANRSALVQKQAEIHLDEKDMLHGLDSLNIEEEDFDDDAMDSDNDDDKKDDVPEPDVEAHHYRLFEKFDDIKSLDQLIKEIPEPEEKKPEVPQGVVRLTKQGITFVHSRAWHTLMARMPPSTSPDTMFEFVLEVLPFFGVDPQALVELRKIWARYKIGGPTLKAWRAEFTQFSAQYPTTWCNVIGAWVARCAHASAQLFLLDWCTSHYQVEAISSRFKCPKESLPDTAASLCVCTVCREIRSLVREPLTASVKQSYTYGLDKVGVNLFSRQVSCRKSKAFMHMQCHTQMPGRVNLLKCVLMYRRKLYLHCPQPNCGHTFRFSAIHCVFSRRGPACPECSLNMIRSTNVTLRKAHPFAVERKLVCFLCNKRISKAANGFIFAKDTIVCANAKHRLKDLVDYVRANVPWATLTRRHESDIAAQVVRQVMLKLREETRSVWAQHNSRKNNAILRQSKKNKWTRAHMG